MKIKQLLAIFVAGVVATSAMAASPLTADMLIESGSSRLVGPKMKGADVLRAQVLLDRAHYSPGEIDAVYGANLRKAINGYQKANGLQVTATVDAPTWEALNADSAPILASYALLDTDVAGPFVPIPAKMKDKAKLRMLGYASVAEALGEKFHVSPSLLGLLNPGKDFGRVGEEIVVPNVALAGNLPKATKMIVVGSERTLALVDTDGKTIAQFPVTTGSKHDPLPLGKWKVRGILHYPVYRYDPKLFWDASPDDAPALIAAGPNNPVGVVWLELSKGHYGIHGTPEPSNIGKTWSHGCVRLTNWDAAAVAQSIDVGIEVLMRE